MPFDTKLFNASATKADAAGAYLNLAITITAIVDALLAIEEKSGIDLESERTRLVELNTQAFDTFKSLTGWEQE